MPRSIILGIVILFACFFGYAGNRLRGGGLMAVSLAVIGAVIALLLMRLMRVF
jgi:uncharacterized membrane protein YeaQ/YmgE (transglycosylase-associated protein family)